MTTVDTPGESPPRRDAVVKTVIQAAAESTERRTTDLPPLYEMLDPEPLAALVASAQRKDTPLTIRFTYAELEVTVDQSGAVRCTRE